MRERTRDRLALNFDAESPQTVRAFYAPAHAATCDQAPFDDASFSEKIRKSDSNMND